MLICRHITAKRPHFISTNLRTREIERSTRRGRVSEEAVFTDAATEMTGARNKVIRQ